MAENQSANQPNDIQGKEEQEPGWLKFWRSQAENIGVIAIALVLAILLRVFVMEPRFIPSDSMRPTLEAGDRVLVEKVSYRFQPPHFGDIIVFNPPAPLQQYLRDLGYGKNQVFIKRTIGTPGHAIAVKAGTVYLDGEPLQEDYTLEAPDYEGGPFPIPDHQLFVMGDNRNNSNDSHVWGFLPEGNVIGRARFRFWPPNRIGWL